MALELTELPEEQRLLITRGYCGRPTRNPAALGPYCKQNAGTRTDHAGTGACWLHGGRNEAKSGRYSEVKKEVLRDTIAEFEEDPAPLETGPEIATVRALLLDHINRYQVFTDALLAWHESYQQGATHRELIGAVAWMIERYTDEHTKLECDNNMNFQILRKWYVAAVSANPKPVQILDLSDCVRHLSEVTKMVERVRKIQNAQAISRKDFARVMQEIGNIIDQCVSNDREKASIRDRVSTLRLA